MTRQPRDVSGDDLIKRLRKLDYAKLRQESTHITVVTELNDRHPITIPRHNPIKPGTLHGILRDVAAHHKMSPSELIDLLFSKR